MTRNNENNFGKLKGSLVGKRKKHTSNQIIILISFSNQYGVTAYALLGTSLW